MFTESLTVGVKFRCSYFYVWVEVQIFACGVAVQLTMLNKFPWLPDTSSEFALHTFQI